MSDSPNPGDLERRLSLSDLLARVEGLAADLEPFAHRKVGSLRIDMSDVQTILGMISHYRALLAQTPQPEEKKDE